MSNFTIVSLNTVFLVTLVAFDTLPALHLCGIFTELESFQTSNTFKLLDHAIGIPFKSMRLAG